jgi:hypothetical protein
LSAHYRRVHGVRRGLVALIIAVVVIASVGAVSPAARNTMRRGVLRAVGEVAAAGLRLHDPYAAQRGVAIGGTPDDFFQRLDSSRDTSPHGEAIVSRVTGFHSGTEPSPLEFEFEHWDDPGLAELRRIFPLDGVPDSAGDYARMRTASAWVSSRLHHGTNAPPLATHFDARAILARSARGEPFDCGTYAWTLIQVLCAGGIQARLVELEADDGSSHSVVESWCDDIDKWVVLDPFTAVTYELRGVPLSSLELHRLWRAGRAAEVRLVPTADSSVQLRSLRNQNELIGFYAHFNVRMRNNVRSARFPRWHPKANRIMSAIEWDGDGVGRPFFRRRVRDSTRVYFELRTTALRWRWIHPDRFGRPRLEVALASSTPNFDSFVLSRDRRAWKPVGSRVVVTVRPGLDTLWFAARNRAGRIGRESWIALSSGSPAPRFAQDREDGSPRSSVAGLP